MRNMMAWGSNFAMQNIFEVYFVFYGRHFRLPFPLFCSAALHKKSSTQVGLRFEIV